MGNLGRSAFLKEGLNRLFKEEQVYLKDLIRGLLSIQNSQAPQGENSQKQEAPPKQEGKKGET
jgi:hypothetical protein